MKREMNCSRRSRAFTLVEMLAVMAIIAMLAAVIVAGSAYAGRRADQKRARAGIERLKLALEAYRVENGRYPPATFNGPMDASQWSVLATLDRTLKHPDDMRDPWGRAYLYTNRSRFAYLIMSKGPKDADAFDDITNEQVGE